MAKYYDRCWNPIFGCSGSFRGCDKCYAKSLMERRGREWNSFGEMKLNKKQMFRKFDSTPQVIAVCTQSDLFQDRKGSTGVETWIVDAVLSKCNVNRQNHYIFLTKFSKNLKGYFDDANIVERLNKNHLEPFSFEGMAFGVSVCAKEDVGRLEDLGSTNVVKHKFVAFEPLLEDIDPLLTDDMLKGVEWVIIGAETGENPSLCRQEWMVKIAERANRLGIPVFVNSVHTDDGKVTAEFEEMDERLRRGDIPFAVHQEEQK